MEVVTKQKLWFGCNAEDQKTTEMSDMTLTQEIY